MLIYATLDNLLHPADSEPPWLTEEPANAANLLRSASIVVAQACQRDLYTDTPSTEDAAVLRDATCAQVQSWVNLNIDPSAAGLDAAPVKKSSILNRDVEYDTSGQAAARTMAATELAPLAAHILTVTGLIYLPVPIGADPTDRLPQWGQGRGWWPYPEPTSGEIEWPYGMGVGIDWPFV